MTSNRQDDVGRFSTRQTATRAAYRAVGRVLTRQPTRPSPILRTVAQAVGRVLTRHATRRLRTPQNRTLVAGQSAGRVVTRHPGGTPLSGCKPDLRNPETPPLRPLRLATIVILAAALTACGWKLRGSYNLPPEITPIAVEGGGVADELRSSLRNSNALAQSADEPAGSNVEILNESEGRRVLSVDIDGKVDEYEIRYEVRWQLTAKGTGDKSRRILVAPTTFRANRSYDYNASTVLSTNEQEQRLVENMRDDIAQRILFRLQGVDAGENEADPDGDANEDDGEHGNG